MEETVGLTRGFQVLQRRMLASTTTSRWIAPDCIAIIALSSSACVSSPEAGVDNDGSRQVSSLPRTSCGNLGDTLGYEKDQLFCFHARNPLANGCDQSWQGDKQWVCDTFLSKETPEVSWRILNLYGDAQERLPTMIGGVPECDLCLAHAYKGKHPEPRASVENLDGYWRLNAIQDGYPIYKLTTHQARIDFWRCFAWAGTYDPFELSGLMPEKVQCAPQPAFHGIIEQRHGIPKIVFDPDDFPNDKLTPAAEVFEGTYPGLEGGRKQLLHHDYVVKTSVAAFVEPQETPLELTDAWSLITGVGNVPSPVAHYQLTPRNDGSGNIDGALQVCEDPHDDCASTLTLTQLPLDDALGYNLDIDLGTVPLRWWFQGELVAEGPSSFRTSQVVVFAWGLVGFCASWQGQTADGQQDVRLMACLTPTPVIASDQPAL